MENVIPLTVTILPSIISGIFLIYVRRYFDRRDKKESSLEEARIRNNELLLRGISASLSLGVETATAIKRSNIASCNGEMDDAKKEALSIKKEIETFTTKQSSKSIIN